MPFLAPVSVGLITGKHYAKNSCLKLYGESENGNCDPAKTRNCNKTENCLRIEQGKRLVEYSHRKKEELKNLNEQITKQDDMVECKPVELSNTYLYISGVSVIGLAIVGYFLYNKFKKPEQNLIDIPPPSNVSNVNTKIEPKRDIFEMY